MTTSADVRIDRLRIAVDGIVLEARLDAPPTPHATIVVATTVGGGEPAVDARPLRQRGFAALVVDLLVGCEHDDPRRRLDTFLLGRRITAVTNAVRARDGLRDLPVGYLGVGIAAAGALVASLDDPQVGAIVVCRGRPDLAQGILDRVTAPTLLVADAGELPLNRSALESMHCPKRLRRASRAVAPMPIATTWFVRHLLGSVPTRARGDHERHTVRGAVPRCGKRRLAGRDETGPIRAHCDGRVLASAWP